MDKTPVEINSAAKMLLESLDSPGPSANAVIIYSKDNEDFHNSDLVYGLFGLSIALEGLADTGIHRADCLGGMASAFVILSSLLVRRMGETPIRVTAALDKIVQAHEPGGAA